MDDVLLKIEAMRKLGLISKEEEKLFVTAYKKGGSNALKETVASYAEEEESIRVAEEKRIESETKALIKEDKALMQRYRKEVQKSATKASNQRLKDYRKFQKNNELKRKKLEVEMAAADRKIDEIIDEATKKIEAEITNKIREKLI